MRRFLVLLAALMVLVTLCPAVLAAGSASMTGPSTVRAGDTITVSFSAGGGILGGSGSVSYDSSLLTLQSYTQVVGGSWQVQFNGNNFLFWDDSMSSPIQGSAVIFKATFQVKSDLPTGKAISVSATGVTLSDGTQDVPVGSATYSVQLAAPLSTNCALESLSLSNATLSPTFSPDVTKYTVSVPYSVSALQLTAKAADDKAKVTIDNPKLAAAATTTVTITVTAENGTVRRYTIQATRAQDPNYVKSNNAQLQSLSAEGYMLSPTFAPDVKQYYLWLPYETQSLHLSAKAADGKASVSIGDTGDLTPGQGTPIAIRVTAEDGSTAIYTVTAVRAPAHEDAEAYLNGQREPDVTEPAPSEPVTEPLTEPTEASTTPTTDPTPSTETPIRPDGVPPLVLIIACLICAGSCVAVGIAIENRRYY